MSDLEIRHDVLRGVKKIAKHIDESERRTYYLLENQHIPGFKIGSLWHSRKSLLNQLYSGRSPESAN